MTRLAVRRPRATLAAWVALVALLGVLGLGIERRLVVGSFVLPGTQSAEADRIARETFGDAEIAAILLKGPPATLRRQGEALVRGLRAHAVTISPWDRGSPGGLRPTPRSGLVLAALNSPDGAPPEAILRRLRGQLAQHVTPPVRAYITSEAVAGEAGNENAIDAAKRAQRIALPILLIVLLLVFRSPLAAAIPAAIGLGTIGAAPGVVALLSGVVQLSAITVSMASMMGLALGVDYSLLIVSRLREERRARPDLAPPDAAALACAAAVRTVRFAGLVLLVAMAIAIVLAPGTVLLSMAAGIAIAVVLSVVSAATAVPAALALGGHAIDRWRIGSGDIEATGLVAVVRRAMRRPVVTLAATTGLLLALATPLLGIRTAPPSLAQLPAADRARTDFERIRDVLGPGWATPFEIAVRTRDGAPVTQASTLDAIEGLQARVARLPGVVAVIGPGQIASRAGDVRGLLRAARRARSDGARAGADLRDLRAGLRSAAAGAGALHDGAREVARADAELGAGARSASGGARRIQAGARQAVAGSARLVAGLGEATAAARSLRSGARRLDEGARSLDAGSAQASGALRGGLVAGAGELAAGLTQATDGLSQITQPVAAATTRLRDAFRALEGMTVGRADPRYRQALRAVGEADAALSGVDPRDGAKLRDGYDGAGAALDAAVAELSRASSSARELASGLRSLDAGLARVRAGTASLGTAARRLASGNAALASGVGALAATSRQAIGELQRLSDAIGGLARGTARIGATATRLGSNGELAAGASRLREHLSSGERESRRLGAGAARARTLSVRIAGLGGGGDEAASGHLVLAGIDVASSARRNQAAMVVATRGDATGARIVVVPSAFAGELANVRLHDRLATEARRFAAAARMEAAVGGLAGVNVDYERGAAAFIPLLIVVLSAITLLVLVAVLRALLMPLVAVALNLLVVGATFGVLRLVFQGSSPPLGGPGFLDVLSAAGIFTVLFALSVDYEIFLLTRMREAYDAHGDPDAAVRFGIARTGRVVTGAALVMVAVFLTFAISEYAVPRQFGVGLAVAVLLDAVVLRMLLLPAAMRLLGARAWWLPGWLERALPRIDVEASRAAR